MGANRTLPTPESYPVAFLETIESGGGVLYEHNMLWTTLSAAKRFRLLLALLRKLPGHRLHAAACARWSVKPQGTALDIRRLTPGESQSFDHAELIGRALSTPGKP